MENIYEKMFISEKDYENGMKTVAEPFLAKLGEDGYFESDDGKKLHYEKYLTENANGSVVISHGFTESAEKFREMAYYFLNMGYNVFAIDHRGHGLSVRLNDDPEVVHITRFVRYVDDFDCFINKVVKPASGELPLYLYCHSMGGAVGVQYLQTHPGVFSKAVLSAPMISANTAGFPHFIASIISRFFIIMGKEKNRVFIYKGFEPDKTYDKSHDTSKARFDYYHAKRLADRNIQTSGASYRWVNEAVKVTALNLSKKRNKAVTLPVLLFQPEEDSSVISKKENVFIDRIPNGKLIKLTNCKHEIYMSVDDTVLEYIKLIGDFLAEK